jgi:hypothetical protein
MVMKMENYILNSKKNLINKKKIDVNIKQIIRDDQIGVECFKKEYGIDLFKLNKKIYYNKVLLALGYNKKRSPKKLAKILGWNNFLKKNLAKLLKIIMNIKYKEIQSLARRI